MLPAAATASPQPKPGCLPSGSTPASRRPASAQPEKVPSKQFLQAALQRLCLGVFTRVIVRGCLDGASRGQTSQAWSHTLAEGPG